MKRMRLGGLLNLFVAAIALFAPAGAASARNNDFGEIINTDFAQGKNSLCALRDRYGFLWVGTLTGLYCFDGNGRQIYPAVSGRFNAVEGSNITTLFEHGDDIWSGAATGLFVFDRKANRSMRFPHKTKYGVRISSPVQKITDAGNGHIWILTHGQGFFVFNVADSTLTQNSRHGTFYSDMAIGADGKVYTITLDGDIQTFNIAGGFIDSRRLPGYVTDRNTLRMVADGKNILAASRTNIYCYDTETHTLVHNNLDAGGAEVRAMIEGGDNRVLLGTDDGVWSYDTETTMASRLTPPYDSVSGKSLLDDRVSALSYDADGSLIIVTQTGGISHLIWKPSDFQIVNLTPEPGKRNQVSAMCPTDDGSGVWIGTKRGLSFYDTETGSVSGLSLSPGVDAEITALDIDGDSLWIGTRHQGLFLYDTQTGGLRKYTYDANTPYAVISNNINKVYRTRQGEIYVLTDWGMCKYSADNDNFTTLAETDSHTPCVTMQEDSHGRLWMSTANNGLFRRESYGTPFRGFGSRSVGKRPVSIMFLDSSGILWVVTQDNNLFYFDEEEGDFCLLNISMSKDYPIIFVEEDLDGCLWVGGTTGGLAKIDPERKLTYYSYLSDANVVPATDASCRLADCRILFGNGNGFRIFNPREMKSDNKLVKVYIQSLNFPYLENNDEELERLGLNILLYTRDEIRLPYTDNTFTLCMSAARSGDMPPVRYDYMLEGVDKAWISGGGPEVTYTDLRPGTYTFLVRPDFGSDLETKKLTIVILPPWYRTWIAYTVYAVLGLLLVWGAVVLSRHRIRRHYQRRINELRIQKEREMFEEKMRFFVNLVHEIRTPLTLISLPLEQMAESTNAGTATPEDNSKHIKSMRRNVNYLLGIINQLLDFRRAENDREVRLVRSHRNVNALLTDICRRFEHPMQAIGKEITLTLPEHAVMANIDPDKTDRVIMNLIGNAEKYSRKRVSVTLHEPADGKFRISVADDGPGIAPNERKKIFDTYYQIEGDNVAATLGTGLGLAYAKLIAKAHGGDIQVENNADGGATFTLSLPANEEIAATEANKAEAEEIVAAEEPVEKRNLTVLLVDDNPELLTTVAEAMGKTYSMLTAPSGEDALEIIETRDDIDVIISDFMMPGMSGAELCRRVKSDVRYSHIPFIILTAKTDSEAKEEGLECGADVYIEKPFTIKQLSLQIANMMKTRELFYSRMSSGEISTEAPAEEAPYLNRLDAEFLANLNDFIRENISDEEFSIDIMAQQMNMSRSSFYRKLKAITGMTPVDYLKNFRLDYSARLLLDGERVTEVALMAGFTSSSYFAKCFKAKFGVIPKEYTGSRGGL